MINHVLSYHTIFNLAPEKKKIPTYPLLGLMKKQKIRPTYPLLKHLGRQLQTNNFLRVAQGILRSVKISTL